MKRLVMAAALSLAACASNQTVLETAATQVFHSDLSPNKVAFCLADKNNAAALDQDDGSKVVLLKNMYGKAAMAFTIYPDGSGSRIEYRKHFGMIGAVWQQCVRPSPQSAMPR